MGSRDPLPVRIMHLRDKIKALDARIGRLMTQRVDMEDNLAKLLEQRDRWYGDGGATATIVKDEG
jgi:chorismate mutase